MTAAAPCRLLDWDTEFFRRRIAIVEGRTLDAGRWAAVHQWCRDNAVEGLTFLASSGDSSTVRCAEEQGFRLMDLRVELDWTPSAPAGPGPGLRPSVESDIAALRAIARESHEDSRFCQDPEFGRERSRALFETWIEKSCRGWATRVWVADLDGRPAGYVTLHLDAERSGKIGLLAVGSFARGRGIGKSLVRQAQLGLDRLTTVTQGRNVAAQRLYQQCGFRTRSVELWFHRWFEGGR